MRELEQIKSHLPRGTLFLESLDEIEWWILNLVKAKHQNTLEYVCLLLICSQEGALHGIELLAQGYKRENLNHKVSYLKYIFFGTCYFRSVFSPSLVTTTFLAILVRNSEILIIFCMSNSFSFFGVYDGKKGHCVWVLKWWRNFSLY